MSQLCRIQSIISINMPPFNNKRKHMRTIGLEEGHPKKPCDAQPSTSLISEASNTQGSPSSGQLSITNRPHFKSHNSACLFDENSAIPGVIPSPCGAKALSRSTIGRRAKTE